MINQLHCKDQAYCPIMRLQTDRTIDGGTPLGDCSCTGHAVQLDWFPRSLVYEAAGTLYGACTRYGKGKG